MNQLSLLSNGKKIGGVGGEGKFTLLKRHEMYFFRETEKMILTSNSINTIPSRLNLKRCICLINLPVSQSKFKYKNYIYTVAEVSNQV